MKQSAVAMAMVCVLGCAGALAEPAAPAGENACAVLKQGQRTAVEYRYKDVTFKPYVRQLFSPKGVNVARDQVIDHIHHHGLMFAWKIDGVNFWEEAGKPGSEMHREIEIGESKLVEKIEWLGPDRKDVLLAERRQVQTCAVDDDATLITWQSTFTPVAQHPSVKLTGGHYHGLGIRFLKSMDDAGPFFNSAKSEGKVFRGTEKLTDGAAWCAYTGDADGKTVTVAMFDAPKNPRPATWFTMYKPFAYLSATMRLHEQPMTVDKPMTLRYGVAVWDGKAEPQRIEKLYQAWVAQLRDE